jgi:hypothetical protein
VVVLAAWNRRWSRRAVKARHEAPDAVRLTLSPGLVTGASAPSSTSER